MNQMKKDKILVWLGADFTHFSIAYFLQKKLDCELYAVVDVTQQPKDFFINQNLIKFKKIWYYHDHIHTIDNTNNMKYLKNTEEKYQLNLWQLGVNERIFYKFFNFHQFQSQEILSIIEQSCKLFEEIIDVAKPDFFLSPTPVFHHHEILYRMLRALGIKCLILSIPRIANKCLISENIHKIDYVDNLSSLRSQGRDEKTLREYIKKYSSQKQIAEYWQNVGGTKFLSLRAFLTYLLNDDKNTKTHYTYYGRTKLKVLSNLLLLKLKKRIRERFINKNLKKSVDSSQPYIYFPLSVDMERNLLIDAPFYTNQLEIIRNIVRAMPVDYKLFVKENPAQVGREWRSISEYKEILAIPNVILHHPSLPGQDLVKDSSLVISIAGASALEAAFYGKSSIIFSDIIYSLIPSVIKINNFDKFAETIKLAINTKPDPNNLDRFIQLLEENTTEFDLLKFINKFDREFYFGGALFDVKLQESKIKKFLDDSEKIIDMLIIDHVKKIEQHKQFRNLHKNHQIPS